MIKPSYRLNEFCLDSDKNIRCNIKFINIDNLENDNYISVIIGKNGTGKSRLLSAIARHFVQINRSKGFVFTESIPKKLIAISNSISDKFPIDSYSNYSVVDNKSDSYHEMYYNYIGNKARAFGGLSNKISMDKAISTILETYSDEDVAKNYRGIFDFLDYEPIIKLEYIINRNLIQHNGSLSLDDLIQYIQVRISSFSSRGENFFERFLEQYREYVGELIDLINQMAQDKFSLEIRVNFSEKNISRSENNVSKDNIRLFKLVSLLRKLNLVRSISYKVYKKGGGEFDFRDSSSGESYLLSTFIALIAMVRDNSLILIDEPEISLHPNWQSMYVDLLTKSLKHVSGCHIIIATHSHFILSDLPESSSTVLTLDNQNGMITSKIIGTPTFGSSAEDILLNVFDLPTTRNYYLAQYVSDVLELLGNGKRDSKEFKSKLEYLSSVFSILKDSDPLKEIIETILTEAKYNE